MNADADSVRMTNLRRGHADDEDEGEEETKCEKLSIYRKQTDIAVCTRGYKQRYIERESNKKEKSIHPIRKKGA